MTLQQNGVLIVDDEPALRKTLRSSLTASGFAVEEGRSGEEAITIMQRCPLDLVLLDINMPGIGGIEACRRIRESCPQTGIIMATVRDLEFDKVRALEAGADDYVTKPLRLRELTARLHAVLRRVRRQAEAERIMEIGDLKIDFDRRLVWRDTEEIHLSPREFDLLSFMMKHSGFPLTHEKLLRSVWGPEYGGEVEYLRSYVRMLRKKIGDDAEHPTYILTEPWVGYRLRNPSDPESQSEQADEI